MLQHRRYRVIITLEDRMIVPSIMKRISDAGKGLASREELRIGIVSEIPRIQNLLKKYENQVFQIRTRVS